GYLGMGVAMVGVVAAGGAYVPLDPGYPASRLSLLLSEARVAVLVSAAELAGRLPADGARVVLLDEAKALPGPGFVLGGGAGPENLVYVMFTSGSTGRPKGVAALHRGVVRLVLETNYFRFGPEEVWLQLAPSGFDASTLELWGALLLGGRLVLAAPGAPTLFELGATLLRHGVTSLHLTSARVHARVEENVGGLSGVRQLVSGGDALSAVHARRAVAALPGTRLWNGYGPTECTTFTCCAEVVGPLGSSVPLGRPIANTRVDVV